ncbi:MAG: hypothetical protein M1475_02760 [Actinobacteria bacterium]|nr:hypothetical protein [Actinomycetota bacterium]
MFGRRKVERPKSPLGIVLYEFDNIMKQQLKDILKIISLNKKLNPARTNKILNEASLRFESFLDDISKDKLKIDYRSDKARDLIIEMITKLENLFERMRKENFNLQNTGLNNIYKEFESALAIRDEIRKKLKDLEYDYA